METTTVSELTINYLTQAQYESEVKNGTVDENAIYLIKKES